jgi:O-antigen/teichoic acid export membrane protein
MSKPLRITSVASIVAVCSAIWAKSSRTAAARSFALLVDQAIASGTNFLTTLVIGRTCLPDELGMYVLGFSLAVMSLRIPKALIWTPYVAFTPSMTDEDRRLYSGSTLFHQMFFAAAAATVVFAIGASMLRGTGGLGSVFVVLGPAIALMLMREHVRRVCFARLRVGDALMIDAAVGVLQTAGMLALALSGQLTAARAFAVIAVASAPTLAVWFLMNRQSMRFRRQRVVSDLARNWSFARWLLAGAIVVGTIAVMEPWALSLMHGTFAAGIFAAGLSIVSLMNPLMMGFQNFFGPQAAHTFAKEGTPGLRRIVIRSTLIVTAVAGVILLGIGTWSEHLLTLLYGAKFAGYGGVVTALVLPTMVELVMLPTASALVALNRGDVMLKSHLVQLALSLTVGMWCIHQFGPQGVGYGASVSYSGAGLWSSFALVGLIRNA